MTEGFKSKDVSELLALCHRRCCVCHRFCGIKIETDHIIPKADGGNDEIENAVPLCFECHAEVHLYNNKHPRGRKYRSYELSKHKEQWLEFCKNNPGGLINEWKSSDSGPLLSLISELKYNHILTGMPVYYATNEFYNSIKNGIFSFIDENIKDSVMATYGIINLTNIKIKKFIQHSESEYGYKNLENEIDNLQKDADEEIIRCINLIKDYL